MKRITISMPFCGRRNHRGNLIQFLPKAIWKQLVSGSCLIFLLALVILTGVVGHRLYNQPQLAEGTRSPTTIVAPSDLTIEDEKKTAEKREAARSNLNPVLTVDQTKNKEILETLDQRLTKLSKFRAQAGTDLFANTGRIASAVQVYLRTCSTQQWEQLVNNLGPVEQPNSIFEHAKAQLYRESQRLEADAFSDLLEQIEQVREQSFNTLENASSLLDLETEQLISDHTEQLLKLSPAQWEQTKTAIKETAENMLAQGISKDLSPKVLNQAMQHHLEGKVPDNRNSLIVASEILEGTLESNLKIDPTQTRRRKQNAAEAVEPVMISVEKGELIVEAGDTISRQQFLLLDAFNLSQRGIHWLGLMGCAGVVTVAISGFWWVKRWLKRPLRVQDQLLLILLSVVSPLFLMVQIGEFSGLPAVGLLVSNFYGPVLALTHLSFVSGLEIYMLITAQEMFMPWQALVTGVVGGLLAAAIAGRLRSREELAILGGAIGLIQGSVYLLLSVIINAGNTAWHANLPEAVLYGLSGLASSIVAFGISPYLERIFDLVTPIRLAELSNPNRPLLQRLALETPGTYQHTLFVSSLAETAARELNCNVELVRAGTLYHDIGKMHDPLGFIENQMGGKNKHDEINDPYESAKIIKKHVSAGLVMARRHGLPKAIRAFIPEHQGRLLISYFYYQAQQQAQQEGKEAVSEADFRYDGPIPQSRETGVVMLADGCEAALRSLNDATPDQALSMVNKIIRARWQDGQLNNADLSREELKQIAQVFVRVWEQTNHKRIAYPKAALDAKYASSMKKQA